MGEICRGEERHGLDSQNDQLHRGKERQRNSPETVAGEETSCTAVNRLEA